MKKPGINGSSRKTRSVKMKAAKKSTIPLERTKRSKTREAARQQQLLSKIQGKRKPGPRKKKVNFVTELVPLETIDPEIPYRFLVQHAPFGIGIIQGGQVVLANPTLAKMLGFRSSSDIEGKPILDFVEEHSRRSFSLLQQRKLRDEAIPSKFELKLYRSDKSLVDVEVSLTIGYFQSATAIISFVNDVTDRKELERRHSDSEHLFRNVVNSIVDALVITDLHGKVLDVNDEFERLTGYSRREVSGAEIPHPWVSEEELRNYIRWLERLRENSYLKDFDVTWIRKDGTPVAVSLSTTMLRNANGEPALMVNIARDISERQQVQRDLAEQFQRIQVLYELSRALTETWDLRTVAEKTYQQIKRVIPANVFFISLYDEQTQTIQPVFAVDETLPSPEGIVHRESPIPLQEAVACSRVIESRESILELRPAPLTGPKYMPFGNKNKPSASLMFVPMFSKERIIGILSVQSYGHDAYSRDGLALVESIASVAAIAVEKVKLHQETVSKSLEIEARNRELDDFTYVVSHDLKEPLISIEGYSKILKQEYEKVFSESGKEFIRSILEACSHTKKLIEDLLQLSRVGKLAEVKHEVNVEWLIAEVLDELKYTVQERKAIITIQEHLPKVVSVETYLKIVFRNLLSNAIKFCDKAVPAIFIGIQPGTERVFFVRDNGIGIEREYYEKIFMIFQRLHKREDYEGTGAGLTIAKKIIEAHGGRIWVESSLGEGSTFYFSVPG
jgi:hypothetical protein